MRVEESVDDFKEVIAEEILVGEVGENGTEAVVFLSMMNGGVWWENVVLLRFLRVVS